MSETSSHENHRRAERKHSAWLEEIEHWRADHRRALDTLEKAAEFIRTHELELERHIAAIHEHEASVVEHEAALAAGTEAHQQQEQHRHLEAVHQEVLEHHNRFRGRHRGLINEILQLQVELHKASHKPG